MSPRTACPCVPLAHAILPSALCTTRCDAQSELIGSALVISLYWFEMSDAAKSDAAPTTAMPDIAFSICFYFNFRLTLPKCLVITFIITQISPKCNFWKVYSNRKCIKCKKTPRVRYNEKHSFTINLTTYGVPPSVYPRGANCAISPETERIDSKRN